MTHQTAQRIATMATITRREHDHVTPRERLPAQEGGAIFVASTLAILGTALAAALFLNI